MGLFNKFKKESKKEESTDIPVPKKIIELSDIKKEKEIKKEQLENELYSLQNELEEKNERLSSIVEKIQLSKNEYDDIIKKLIQSKKELRTGSNQTKTTLIGSSKEEVSKEIRDSKIQLQKIQDDIINNTKLNE